MASRIIGVSLTNVGATAHKTEKCYKKIANDKRLAAEKAKAQPHRGKQKDKKASAKALTLAKALIAMTEGADGQESYSEDDST